jgi:hypothetical protein
VEWRANITEGCYEISRKSRKQGYSTSIKGLLECYIETGMEHQVLSPCNEDGGNDDDDLQVDGFVDGRNAVAIVTSVTQSTRTTG